MPDERPGSLTPKLSEMLIAEIKRQDVSGKSSREISREFGVHYQTVANYRRKLEKAGVITRLRSGRLSVSDSHPAGRAPPPEGTFAVADFWSTMPDLAVLTGEQILKRLTYLSMSPSVPPTVHVAAAKALYELREAEAAKESLTSHDPRTPAEFSERLYVMRSSVGKEAWLAADLRASLEESSWKKTRLSPPSASPSPTGETPPTVDAPPVAAASAAAPAAGPSPTSSGPETPSPPAP